MVLNAMGDPGVDPAMEKGHEWEHGKFKCSLLSVARC